MRLTPRCAVSAPITSNLYQLHWDDPTTPLDETSKCSIRSPAQAKPLISASRTSWPTASRCLSAAPYVLRGARYVSVQPRYNLLFREIERELLPLAHEE